MKGPSNERLRKPSSATPLCPASPLGSSKLKILCVLSGSAENRLVSVDRRGGIGLAKLRARLAAFAPPGAPFFLRYELPPLPGAVPLAGEEDVERMVAAHDRLAAEQGRCPRVRVYLLDVGPISPTTVLQGGAVLGDLNDRNPKRWPDPSQIDSCGVCCSPPAVGNRAELLRRNGGFHGGIALPWSHLATGAHSNKRQLQYGFTGASCGRARKYENGWGGVANRGIGFEASNAHAGARRRWGNAKTSHPKAYQQQSLVSPINSTIQRAAAADSNNSPFSPGIGTVGMDSEAVVKKSMSRLLNSLLEQVSLEAKKELDHINSNNAGNNANLTNILDVSSKEVVEDPQRIPAAYTLLASQELQTIQNSDLEELRELGSGRYGTVFYGKWRGSDVAIKRLRSSCFSGGNLGEEKMVTDFWKEARLLGQLHHPNVVAFYGVVSDGPVTSLAIVTEYMVNGSLKQVMRRKDRTIDRRKRLIIAMDAAFGMEYLHEKNVVHFDLKSHNLFVNIKDPQRPICKIGDLGLSKVKQHTLVSGGIRGTIPWMAPELFSSRNNMVTDKVDVYSFGIIMWELLTGEEPYENMPTEEILAGILKGDLRPAVSHWCDPDWRSLMERCWSSSPDARPSFSEVARELRTIAASMNIK